MTPVFYEVVIHSKVKASLVVVSNFKMLLGLVKNGFQECTHNPKVIIVYPNVIVVMLPIGADPYIRISSSSLNIITNEEYLREIPKTNDH